jgi:hypothetical protein
MAAFGYRAVSLGALEAGSVPERHSSRLERGERSIKCNEMGRLFRATAKRPRYVDILQIVTPETIDRQGRRQGKAMDLILYACTPARLQPYPPPTTMPGARQNKG